MANTFARGDFCSAELEMMKTEWIPVFLLNAQDDFNVEESTDETMNYKTLDEKPFLSDRTLL